MMKKNIFIVLLFSVLFVAAQENNYITKNSDINSLYSDFGVVYYGDNAVVFTSARKDITVKKKRWINNDQPFLDIYKGDMLSVGKITNVRLLSKGFKGKFHISNIAFTKDFKTVYFSGNDFLNKKNKKHQRRSKSIELYKAKIGANGEWIDIKKLPFNRDSYNTGHPSLNAKEDKLYFISDMNTPNSYGGTDIYVVSIKKDGSYGIPKNLGPNVNTSKNEMFPFISTDNVLYYSSNGFSDTYGGLDIYTAKLIRDSVYFKPKNVGKPINSRKDDHSFVINNDKRTGFFASNRKGGKGDDDIYFFVNLDPALDIEDVFEISGVVKNNKSKALLPETSVVLYEKIDGAPYKKIDSVSADSNAYYNLKNIKSGAEYKIIASLPDYKSRAINVSYLNEPKEKEVEDIYLDKIEHKIEHKIITPPLAIREVRVNKRFNASSITYKILDVGNTYFGLNSSYLTSKSKSQLNKIVNILRENLKLNIECASHTSSRGTYKYNMWLSNRRAKSIADYLILKGISKYRITSKGYGETQIVNKCFNGVICKELEHAKNRRNEFRIIKGLKDN